jgi:hypothetical protein
MVMMKEISDNLTVIESDNDVSYDTESQLISDIAESPISDTIESHDPSLTVKEPLIKSDSAEEQRRSSAESGEDSRIIADDEVTDENITEWFAQRKEKMDVRSGAEEEIERQPRTEESVKSGIRAAVLSNLSRNVENSKDPVIESFLATVPEHVRPLARVFCEHKKRPPLKKEGSMWRREWQDQYDIGLKAEDVEKAITYMGQNNLGVRSPVSTLTIAENIRLGHIKIESSETSQFNPVNVQVAETADESIMDKLIDNEEHEDGREIKF